MCFDFRLIRYSTFLEKVEQKSRLRRILKVSAYGSFALEKPQLLSVGLKPSGLFKVFTRLILAFRTDSRIRERKKATSVAFFLNF